MPDSSTLTEETLNTTAASSALVSFDQIALADEESLAQVGVLLDSTQRSATMMVRDSHPVCLPGEVSGLEMRPIADALEMYDWLREKYFWQAISPDQDEVTAEVARQAVPQGFFVRVRRGAKVELPCQAALYMTSDGITQAVHNVVILEEDSELHMITGCVTHHQVRAGLHLAASEQYVGRNARLINTMVHNWGPEVVVRPRATSVVEAGGRFESNYVSLRSAKDILSNPKTFLNGPGASAKFFSVILAGTGSTVDTGGEVYLNARNTGAELIHRGVCTGGHIFQRGLMVGNAQCRAHIDCAGMLLDSSGEGFIESSPGLRALNHEAQLSHEASIGKIAPEQIEYLQSRGMTESEATSLIIRGFLGGDIIGLGDELDAKITEIADLAGQGG